MDTQEDLSQELCRGAMVKPGGKPDREPKKNKSRKVRYGQLFGADGLQRCGPNFSEVWVWKAPSSSSYSLNVKALLLPY